MISGNKKVYREAKANYDKELVVQRKEVKSREKAVGSFVKNLSSGGGKSKKSVRLGVSLTGNRRY